MHDTSTGTTSHFILKIEFFFTANSCFVSSADWPLSEQMLPPCWQRKRLFSVDFNEAFISSGFE